MSFIKINLKKMANQSNMSDEMKTILFPDLTLFDKWFPSRFTEPEPTHISINSVVLSKVVKILLGYFKDVDCVVEKISDNEEKYNKYVFNVEIWHKYTPIDVVVSIYNHNESVIVEWKKLRGCTLAFCDAYRTTAQYLLKWFGDIARDNSGFATRPQSYEEEQYLPPLLLSSENLKEALSPVIAMLESEWDSSKVDGCVAVAVLAEQPENALLMYELVIKSLCKHVSSNYRKLALSAISAIGNIANGLRLRGRPIMELEYLITLLDECMKKFTCPKMEREISRTRTAILG